MPSPMIVGVHPLAGFDKILHYHVPEALEAAAQVGALVRVPVGRAARLGGIGQVGPPSDYPVDRLKAVAEVIYPFPALTPDLLDLARWMAGYYAAPLDTVIETMIPAAVRHGAKIKERSFVAVGARLGPEERAALGRKTPAQAKLYAFLEGQIRPQPRALILRRTGSWDRVCVTSFSGARLLAAQRSLDRPVCLSITPAAFVALRYLGQSARALARGLVGMA